MKKLKWSELKSICKNTVYTKSPAVNAVIVFNKNMYKDSYDEIDRSYKISSDAKYFNPLLLGNSLFGECLNNSEPSIRLENLVSDENIEYCYII